MTEYYPHIQANFICYKLCSYCMCFWLATCPVKGQVLKNCTSCATTCTSRFHFTVCPINCTHDESRCECPDGTVIDEDRNECVSPDECPESMTTTCIYNLYCS